MVLTGPSEPMSEALPEPMRRMANDSMNTGSTVEKIAIAQRISQQVENATIVFIVCDRGDRYLSTGVFPE